jgi:ABC-2 type transport system ATP-binding protein
MEEAERLCHRVGIMDAGRLVAEGTRRELTAAVGQQDRLVLAATGNLEELARCCAAIDGVTYAGVSATGVEVLAEDGRRLLTRVVEAADAAGAVLGAVEIVEPDLEAVFLHLTGKALRDE